MQKEGYRYFAYLDLRTGDRFISVGTKVLLSKLGISKTTLYNRVKVDGWCIDEDYVVFYVDKKDILHDAPKNNNLKSGVKDGSANSPKRTDTVGVVPTPKKPIKPKQNRTDRLRSESENPKPDEVKGDQGGSQSSDHEKVPTAPLPSDYIKGMAVLPVDPGLQARLAEAVKNGKDKEVPVGNKINEDLLV